VDDSSFGCATCYRCEAPVAWAHRPRFRSVARLLDEPHFGVSILECPECGQAFVSVFAETIDWADGDDPQEWRVVPVTAVEAQALVAQGDGVKLGAIEEVGVGRRFLEVSHPKAGPKRIAGRAGALLLPPHD
jgi:hypothetical protein